MTALLLVLAVAHATGWRNDGTGRWPATAVPERWSAEELAWSTPLASWSNASPVPWKDLVCATLEPVSVICLDARTGTLRFTVSHPVVDAVEGELHAKVASLVAEAPALEASLRELQRTYSELQREARRSGAAAGDLQAVADRLEAVRARLDEADRYRTPPTQGLIGWSAPTPLADGDRLYALFANGVVAAHDASGRVLWRRWLGERPESMLGYPGGGHASSLVLADGVLVAPFGRLTGLDPRTGEVMWRDEPIWRHYGTPAVARVGGRAWLLTPDGRVLRPSDGTVVDRELADQWYVGPVVDDDRVVYLESRAAEHVRRTGGTVLKTVRLRPTPDGVAHEELWSVTLPVLDPFYAGPVVHAGRIYLVSANRHLVVVDAASGAVRSERELEELGPYQVYASPAVAGGRLWVASEFGTVLALTLGDEPRVLASSRLEPMRTTPAFAEGRIWLRTKDRLVMVENR